MAQVSDLQYRPTITPLYPACPAIILLSVLPLELTLISNRPRARVHHARFHVEVTGYLRISCSQYHRDVYWTLNLMLRGYFSIGRAHLGLNHGCL